MIRVMCALCGGVEVWAVRASAHADFPALSHDLWYAMVDHLLDEHPGMTMDDAQFVGGADVSGGGNT